MTATFIPAPLRLGLSRFWLWWSGELLGVLPDRLRERLLPAGQRLVVDFAGDRVNFVRSKGSTAKRVGSILLSEEELDLAPDRRQVDAVRRIVDRAGLGGVVGLLRLPREKVLRRLVDLPAAAAENLREVLGFEMDRQTPFKADEVCFDFRIRSHDTQHKRIKVDLVVVPREVVDRVMRLAEAWGLDLDLLDLSVKVPQDDQLFDLLPRARRDARARLRRTAMGLATVTVLARLGWFIPYRHAAAAQARSRHGPRARSRHWCRGWYRSPRGRRPRRRRCPAAGGTWRRRIARAAP